MVIVGDVLPERCPRVALLNSTPKPATAKDTYLWDVLRTFK